MTNQMENRNQLTKKWQTTRTELMSKGISFVKSSDVAVLNREGTQISVLKKTAPKLTILLIVYRLEMIYSIVGDNKKLNEESLLLFASYIIDQFYYMKIEEFDYIIDQGIKGNYGKTYGAIDGPVILDWIRQYETSDDLIRSWEMPAENFKDDEQRGRNTSVLESDEFVKRLKAAIPDPAKNNEEYKEARDEYLKTQDKSTLT